jgi:hypothetical protein
MKSSKHQHPGSREIPNHKHQAARVFGAWSLVLLWSLELGFWCLRGSAPLCFSSHGVKSRTQRYENQKIL